MPANKKQNDVFTFIRRLPGSPVSIPGTLKNQPQSIKQLTSMVIIAAILEIYLTLVFNYIKYTCIKALKVLRAHYQSRKPVFGGLSAVKFGCAEADSFH